MQKEHIQTVRSYFNKLRKGEDVFLQAMQYFNSITDRDYLSHSTNERIKAIAYRYDCKIQALAWNKEKDNKLQQIRQQSK